MRVWQLARTGGPDVLRLVDAPDPVAGPGELVVRVEAIGINYAEVLSRKGLYSWAPRRPYVPGMEAAGTVESVGPGVERRLGEDVLCGMQHGAYAERVVVPSGRAMTAPAGYSLDERAAFAVNFMTAWVALMEMARLRPDDHVAITAAGGGVGTAAVQIASSFGCRVTALAGSGPKLDLARRLGARAAVDYRRADFMERLEEATSAGGFDVVLEVVGGEVFRSCQACLAPFGRIVVAGYAGLDYNLWNPRSLWRAWRDAPRMSVMRSAVASTGVLATHIGYLLRDQERLLRVWSEMTDFVVANELRPVVGTTYDFEELPEAHRFMESPASMGNLVVRLRGSDGPAPG